MITLLWVVAAILLLLWIVGLVAWHTIGALVWIFLVAAIVVAVISLFTGGGIFNRT
jgi:hypothetical protein